MRRKLEDENIRKVIKVGDSYAVTIPIGVVRALSLREKQKVIVEKRGQSIVIKDWEINENN